MRKAIVFLILALVAPLTARAQSEDKEVVSNWGLYHQTFVRHDSVTPRVFLKGYEYFTQNRKKKACGMWATAYAQPKYISSVVGPFCDFFSGYLSIGVSAGVEEFQGEGNGKGNTFYGRYAGTVSVETDDERHLEVYCENGPSKLPWCEVDLQLWTNEMFTLGGIAQTDDGVGPKLDIYLFHWKEKETPREWALHLWAAPVWKGKERGLLLGAQVVGLVQWSK